MLQDVHQVVDERLVEFAEAVRAALPPTPRELAHPVCQRVSQPLNRIDLVLEQMSDLVAGVKPLRRQQHRVSALTLAVGGSC